MIRAELLAFLVPLPPLLAFFLIVLLTNRRNRLSHRIAVGAMVLSWAMAMVIFGLAVSRGDLGQYPLEGSVAWLPMGENVFHIGILIDPLNAITLFFVAWTCLAIFLYSVGYHNFGKARDPQDRAGLPPKAGGIEPMYARFFAFISLFAFGMLTLSVSDNLLLLFIGWEIMGLCSYLLIGFWYGKDSAKRAMVKAFITTRVGDVFMLLGIAFGSFEFISLWRKGTGLRHRIIKIFLGIGIALATIGVFMIPFHILLRIYIFFLCYSAASVSMSLRFKGMERKCNDCEWKGNWYQCPGFEELNSKLDEKGLQKRDKDRKWDIARKKSKVKGT